jgi:DNA-binding transcriptional MerR regulator
VTESLTAGAVARRLGVAVTTLRTWHQRYGLGPTGHEPGHHRRYTAQDIERLEEMQRLIVDGVPPGEAARWAARKPRDVVHAAARRDGGGLALGAAGPAARGLSRAALRLDAPAVRERVAEAVAADGVVAAWEGVLQPVLVAIGERHAATGGLVEVEHLLSVCISAILGAVPRPAPGTPVKTLLACADEEQHSLPLEALAAALASAGLQCRMLGARVPQHALVAAVRRTGPTAVVLWSHTPDTADLDLLMAITAERVRPLVVAAAGPGWFREKLPAGVVTPDSLGEAVELLADLP